MSIIAEDEKVLMTTKRFKELISQEQHKDLYESKNQIEGLCKLGVDLINFVSEKDWELTHKFTKIYFAYYFNGSIVFGINLVARPKLFFKLRDAVIREHADRLNEAPRYEKFDFLHQWAIYPEHVTAADITDMLELAYAWHAGLL